MFKNLTNLASAMRNVTQLGPQLKAINAKLEAARVFGSAVSAGHSVNVEMSGMGIVRLVSVSDGLLSSENKSLLEQLTMDSMNQAIRSAKEMHVKAFKELTGGVDLIPGLNEMIENMAK
ncbi:MAG: YbaB/EbfC family nucleoid-associated protein [Pirellula sp.]